MALDTYAAITLADLKATLGIASTADDAMLEQAINFATEAVEAMLSRRIVERRFLEWHDGGADSVILKNAPVSQVHWLAAGAKTALVVRSTDTADIISAVSVTDTGVTLRRMDSSGAESISSRSFSLSPSTSQLVAWINGVTGFAADLQENCAAIYLHRMQSVDLRRAAAPIRFADDTLEPNRADLSLGLLYFKSAVEWRDEPPRGARAILVDYTAGWPLAQVPRDIQQLVRKVAAAAFYQRKADPSLASEALGDYSYSIDPTAAYGAEAQQLAQRWRRVR